MAAWPPESHLLAGLMEQSRIVSNQLKLDSPANGGLVTPSMVE
jgi:hypothetical protein